MRENAITTLCRFFAGAHHKSGGKSARAKNRNFVAGMIGRFCSLCRLERDLRNGVTPAIP
jgi:hypothetical protein